MASSAADHPLLAELDAGLPHVLAAPKDVGTVEMVVSRPAVDERSVLESAELTCDDGLVGDSWLGRAATSSRAVDPGRQLTVMSSRAADLVSGSRERWPLCGDQVYVDLDLSESNLPAGSRLRLGAAVIEVSQAPHTGCSKFAARFGTDSFTWVNSPAGRAARLRGLNASVVTPGVVRVGDRVAVIRLGV